MARSQPFRFASLRNLRRILPLVVEHLEDRLTPAAPFPEFLDPNPAVDNRFGNTVVALSTGNVVITSPGDDFAAVDAGAVYLFNGPPVRSSARSAAPPPTTAWATTA